MNRRVLLTIMLGVMFMAGVVNMVAASAESSPPKPPNCPDLPERKNLVLADGSIADVRIVQFGSTNLYIPTSWVQPYFFSKDPVTGTVLSGGLTFVPELHQVECPGVVHALSLDQSGPVMTLWSSKKGPLPTISAGEVSMLRITADLPNPGERLRVVYGRLHHLPKLKPVPGIVVYLGIDAEIRTKNVESPAIEDLVRWLASPPNRRDNSRAFVLKVESR
ncbi:hypothetical protein GWE18_27830 [Bradyrhizobium sp. CSA112]|uniref:hypothetical protein n=1 Tax=Bradyrhizobium sp. CSA112 TaxID=2699170 RepID=UPI0023B118BA|nr:hypothetical protein [Bradyrhizobium sp. CSA112]MDE5456570.1 hypothetical protein [Bradyrhizobium sp. CSA112]